MANLLNAVRTMVLEELTAGEVAVEVVLFSQFVRTVAPDVDDFG